MYQMGPLFMLPPAYYRLYRPVVIPQPFSGYSSQAILNFVPDDKLGDYQRAFLSGEDLPPVGNFPPSKNPVDLSIAICQSLSACGSLKKGPTPGTGQPNQEMEPSVKPTISTAKQGYAQTLSGWMKDFPGSSEHNAALEKAIQSGPEDLARQKQDIWISDHIDFGLKHAGSTWYKSLPRYFRTFIIVNTSEQAVVLLDVCGVPSVNHTFVLHDDYGLAHHYHSQNHHKSDPKGVILPRHSQYQVTIELQCNPEDCALHQQWLMFTFAVIDWKVKSKLAADKGSVFTISRRISALVVKHVQDVQTCLSIEAKPFYPLSLRAVFDKEPAQFSYADKSPCKKYMDFVRTQNSSRQIGHLSVWKQSFTDLEKCIEANDRDQASVLSSNVDRQPKKDRIPPLSSRCSCYKRQLVQLVRLLGLEEAAMELDIREHDLLNTLMECIDYQENRFRIEVPGLPENRPSVFKGDVVYVRWATMPQLECAALVLAVEMQPKPQIIIKLSAAFLSPLVSEFFGQVAIEERILRLNLQRVHVRFMIDRLIIKNMHTAIRRTASSSAKLLPCMCTGITNTGPDFELAKPDSDIDSDEKRSIAGKKFLINKCLNEEQQVAVKAVLNMVDGPGPYIIFGPPGTGKTVTVVECVLQVLKSKKSSLLCVCAPSNYAADILCSGISKGGISPGKMWRFNDPRRTVDSVKADVIKFCSMADGVFTNMHPNFSTLRVIVCTCAAAAMLHEDPTKSRVSFVTHIFIDEAGQALIPETLIPLSLANQDTCCVLCGDPKQLGPVVHSKLAATNGLAKSLLEHFTLSPQYKLEGPNRPSSARVIKLLRNYRANGKLLELPSRMFYENELIASAEEQSVAPPEWEEMNDINFPMLFYGVKGQQMREGESPSYFNAVEITKVADLITGLIEKTNVRMEDIGVMAPYRRQVHKLRLVLRARNMRAIRVGTVDDYQGQEEKIMFISTVLTRPESLRRAQTAGAPEQNIGFLSNAKRFNVAITRAKAMLVVVGHPVILSADENWQVLLRHCLSRGAYRGYGRDRVPVFLPSSSALKDPFWDSDELDEELDARERNEMDNAIERIAEMSLLGLGDVERLYPDTLDSYYAANSEDQEWRVVL